MSSPPTAFATGSDNGSRSRHSFDLSVPTLTGHCDHNGSRSQAQSQHQSAVHRAHLRWTEYSQFGDASRLLPIMTVTAGAATTVTQHLP